MEKIIIRGIPLFQGNLLLHFSISSLFLFLLLLFHYTCNTCIVSWISIPAASHQPHSWYQVSHFYPRDINIGNIKKGGIISIQKSEVYMKNNDMVELNSNNNNKKNVNKIDLYLHTKVDAAKRTLFSSSLSTCSKIVESKSLDVGVKNGKLSNNRKKNRTKLKLGKNFARRPKDSNVLKDENVGEKQVKNFESNYEVKTMKEISEKDSKDNYQIEDGSNNSKDTNNINFLPIQEGYRDKIVLMGKYLF